MDSLSADIAKVKADNQLELAKPILLDRFFIFQRAALLLNERNNLPVGQLEQVKNLFNAIANRTPIILPPAAPLVAAVVESPYSKLTCDSEGRAIITELLTV